MSHIFISYARKDIEFAGKIVRTLAEKELDTWIDWRSIPKGEYWEQEIYRGIEEADAFLFLVSPDSIRSQMCNKEIAHAVKNSKRILPIVVRDTDVANFLDETSEQEISKRNWIFCRDGQDDFIQAIEETVETIHTDYEWLKHHTRLQIQALEWERSNHEKSFLLHGKELQDAELQLAMNSSKEPFPTDLQRYYVLQSRQSADQQRKSIIRITVTAALVMAGLAIYGFVQARRAEERANIALARQLAAQAITLADNQTDLALLLGIEANHLIVGLDPIYRLDAKDGLLRALAIAPNLETILRGHTDSVQSIAFSPDGRMLASGSFDGTVPSVTIMVRQLRPTI